MYLFGYYLVISPALIWIFIGILFLIIEAFTLGLTTIWFCIGAVAASLVSLVVPSVALQLLVFLAVSIVLLYFTKPIADQKLKIGQERTNVNAVIGRDGIVLETIEPFATGQVKLDGQIWTAISHDNSQRLEKGTEVYVIEVQGVKLLVAKK